MRTADRGLPPAAYRAYMASAEWEARKEWWRAKRPRDRRCRACGSHRYALHHRTYRRLGREHVGDLVPLCQRHHHALHRLQDRMGWSVERASSVYLVGAGVRRGIERLLTTPPGWAVLALSLVLALR